MPRQHGWVDKKEQNGSAIGILFSLWKAPWREVFPQKVYMNASRSEQRTVMRQRAPWWRDWTTAAVAGLQLVANAHGPGKYHSSQQILCASLEKRPWEDWYGSHQGRHKWRKFWGLNSKYCGGPGTMDTENQRYVFWQHQKRESDAGISS